MLNKKIMGDKIVKGQWSIMPVIPTAGMKTARAQSA